MSTTLLEGHVLAVLEGLPAGHFHTVCTSPPYWQLRAYGTPPQVWDGAAGCEHSWGEERTHQRGGLVQHPDMVRGEVHREGRSFSQIMRMGAFCQQCGAWRGELGQEPDPELYVAHLVSVFEAVRRVLRDDGTLWVNLAGSYYSEPGGQNGTGQSTLAGANSKLHALRSISEKAKEANRENGRQKRAQHPVYKPLDWVDVPGMFARAMQEAGWLWRSDVVWVKPSALPESVQGTRFERCRVKVRSIARSTEPSKGASPHGPQSVGLMAANTTRPNSPTTLAAQAELGEWADCPGCPKCSDNQGLVLRRGSGRPTKSTERVLQFAKKQGYYFDQEAVRENLAEATISRDQYSHVGVQKQGPLKPGDGNMTEEGLTRTTAGLMRERTSPAAGRNLRDWWVLSPEPLKLEHYAAFPSALPERCIKAGTSEWGCCPGCGAPWARVVERSPNTRADTSGQPCRTGAIDGWRPTTDPTKGNVGLPRAEAFDGATTTLGWRRTCRCPEQPPVPCRVLDPFGGSGTTALAANRLGRDCTLVELKPQYAALARKRVGREPLNLFATHGTGEDGEAAVSAEEPEAQEEGTKQERHPNRTFARVPPLVEAGHRPVGDTGGILPVEETEGAVAGG